MARGATCTQRGDEPGIFATTGCNTPFAWSTNTVYTMRWTIGAREGTGRWFHAALEWPGFEFVMPSFLIETGAADSPMRVLAVTTFTEWFADFTNCEPPPSSTAADFGAPAIGGRALAPAGTNTTWCVDATIEDSVTIPGGRRLQY